MCAHFLCALNCGQNDYLGFFYTLYFDALSSGADESDRNRDIRIAHSPVQISIFTAFSSLHAHEYCLFIVMSSACSRSVPALNSSLGKYGFFVMYAMPFCYDLKIGRLEFW